MATSNQNEIGALVAKFTDDLQLLVQRSALERVLAALGGPAPAATRRLRGPSSESGQTRVKRARKGGRRTSENVEQMGATLLAHIQKNPGQRGEQVAKALRTDVKTMRLPMLKLIADKKIKTKGNRRGMTYFSR